MKRKLKEITTLTKVEEISVCHKDNPPANGLLQFDIIKNSVNKSEFEDLFKELSQPEYMDFTSYLALWLEDDVNFVAYQAFLDALFFSLQDVCYNEEFSKEDKLQKLKENFDSFLEEYKNSVITKTEDGKVLINMNKSKEEKIDFRKSYAECVPVYCETETKTFSEIIDERMPERISNELWGLFIYRLEDHLHNIHYADSEKYSKEEKAKMIIELFDEFVSKFNETELIKSKLENKQEKKMSFNIIESLKSLINKAEEVETIEPIIEEVAVVAEEIQPETEAVVEEIVEEKIEEITEVVEKTVEGEEVLPEEQPSPEEAEIAEPEAVEAGEEVIEQPEVVAEEVPAVEEIQPEAVVEEVQEPVEKSTNVEELINKATKELQAKIELLEKDSKENIIKLEKAELTKSVESEYSGLVGKTEDIVEVIYELNKSSLSLESREFVLEGLKALSAKNTELTKAVGVEVDEVDEEKLQKSKEQKEIQRLIKEEGLTENQAYLVATKTRTLKEAKEISKKVNKK